MPCEWLKSEDGTLVHIHRGRTRGRKRFCKFCRRSYYGGKLCDFPVGEGRTCDAEMCDECARTVGTQETDIGHGMKRVGDTIDVCPIHRNAWRQSMNPEQEEKQILATVREIRRRSGAIIVVGILPGDRIFYAVDDEVTIPDLHGALARNTDFICESVQRTRSERAQKGGR